MIEYFVECLINLGILFGIIFVPALVWMTTQKILLFWLSKREPEVLDELEEKHKRYEKLFSYLCKL